jgi:hypothetical protein
MVEAWRVDQSDLPATVAMRDHAARAASHRRRRRSDIDGGQSEVVVELDTEDVQAVETDEQVESGAVPERRWQRAAMCAVGSDNVELLRSGWLGRL